jgi:hypothetical protein
VGEEKVLVQPPGASQRSFSSLSRLMKRHSANSRRLPLMARGGNAQRTPQSRLKLGHYWRLHQNQTRVRVQHVQLGYVAQVKSLAEAVRWLEDHVGELPKWEEGKGKDVQR